MQTTTATTTTDARLATFATLDGLAELDANLARRKGSAADPLGDHADDLVERAERHVMALLDRGEARGIVRVANEAYGLRALDDLLASLFDLTLPAGYSDADADAVLAACHESLNAEKHGAEIDASTPAAMDQCRDVDGSAVRTLLRAWGEVEEIRRLARDGILSADHARALASEIVLGAPSCPHRSDR